MRRRLSTILAALAVVASTGPASGSQDRPSVVSSSKMTTKDVLQMQSGGLSGEIIIEKIKRSGCGFDTAPGSLSELKSAGVPDSVILAVMRCQSPEGQPGPPPEPAKPEASGATKAGTPLPDELGVYRLKDGKFVPIKPEILNLRTARGAQLLVGIAAAAKLNGYVTNQHSSTHFGPDSDFVVKLAEGTDPAEYVCLKFNVKGNRREVELARGRINMSTGTQRAAIPFTSERLAKQTYRLKFGQELRSGEYGVLPPKANGAYAGKIYTFLVE